METKAGNKPGIYGYTRLRSDDVIGASALDTTPPFQYVEIDIVKDSGGYVVRLGEHERNAPLDSPARVRTLVTCATLASARGWLERYELAQCKRTDAQFFLCVKDRELGGEPRESQFSYIGPYVPRGMKMEQALAQGFSGAQPVFG